MRADQNPKHTVMEGRTTLKEKELDDVRKFVHLDVLPLDTIRQSNTGTFAACPRKFLYSERMGLQRAGYKQAPMIGQWFHLCHSARYAGRDELAVESILGAAVDDFLETLNAWVENGGSIQWAENLQAQVQKDSQLARIMSKIHWEQKPLDTDSFDVISLEEDMTVKLPDVPVPLGGRLDLVLYHKKKPEGIVVVDHKTTTRNPRDWMRAVKFSSQPQIYRVLAEERFKGQPVIGMIHNLVKRPRLSWKDWQSWDDYLQEIRDWYQGRSDQVGTGDTYKSGPRKGRPRPRWDHTDKKDEWNRNPPIESFFTIFTSNPTPTEFMKKMHMMARAATCTPSLSNFPRLGADAGRCEQYGSICPFIDLCDSGPEQWESIIEEDFRQRSEEDTAPSFIELLGDHDE